MNHPLEITNKPNQIPKIIHFCWFGGAPYPDLIQKCMKTWELYLNGWEIKKWDETNIPENIPFLKYALEQKMYAFAADYMRFYALKNHGGIYLDTDIEVVQDMTPLLNHHVFLASECIGVLSLNGAVIGGEVNASFFKDVLNYYDSQKVIKFETIPHVLTKVYHQNPTNITILPYYTFYPYNPYDVSQLSKQLMYMDIKKETYAIHHWYKSWKFTKWQKLLNSIKKRLFV